MRFDLVLMVREVAPPDILDLLVSIAPPGKGESASWLRLLTDSHIMPCKEW